MNKKKEELIKIILLEIKMLFNFMICSNSLTNNNIKINKIFLH